MVRLLWLLLAGLLQACAGTPVAEQLERSFAVPEETPNKVSPVEASEISPTLDRPAASEPEAGSTPDQPSTSPAAAAPVADSQNSQQPSAQQPSPPTSPSQPPQSQPAPSQSQSQEPYRITIRLAGADPAAPAEAVTRALREADVGFAVERIERVEP